MKINQVIWYSKFVAKLRHKHKVEIEEVEQALKNRKRIRKVKRGNVRGEDIYLALGQTEVGRHLSIFFIYKKSQDAIVISARDMDGKERREYERAKTRTHS